MTSSSMPSGSGGFCSRRTGGNISFNDGGAMKVVTMTINVTALKEAGVEHTAG